MTGGQRIYIIVLFALVVGVGVLESMNPKATDWTPSYSRYHTKPYGSKYLYDRLTDVFPDGIRTVEASEMRDQWGRYARDEYDESVNHLYVSTRFMLPDKDLRVLLQQVHEGDDLLVAAHQLGYLFSDTLEAWVDRDYSFSDQKLTDVMTLRFKDRAVSIKPYDLLNCPGGGYFDQLPKEANILAVDGRSRPVIAHIPWGEGNILLCAEPRLLTNFNMVSGDNAEAIGILLGYMSDGPVSWNEYRKFDRLDRKMTPLRWILEQPPLAWAYYLALVLLLAYIALHIRRQQRSIPVIPPVRNDSRDFVHTMGQLYYNKGDHADLARKMITFFKEDVRQRAHMASFNYGPDTTERLARRSGMPVQEMHQLLGRVQRFELASSLSAIQLTELDSLLHRLRSKLQ